MRQRTRRERLREATAPTHRALEAIVGPIDSLPRYRRYLLGIAAFRSPIEEGFPSRAWPAEFQNWRPTEIAAELRQDLNDLGLEPVVPAPIALASDIASALGTLYVLEGSSLGARLVYRDALKLGLTERHGARHLSRQIASDSWRGFVSLLDRAPSLDFARLADAANDAFEAARVAMLKVQDEEL